jgi:threonine efflux protein
LFAIWSIHGYSCTDLHHGGHQSGSELYYCQPFFIIQFEYTRQIDVGLAVFLVEFSLNNAIPVFLGSR